jgi:hypothetical protein
MGMRIKRPHWQTVLVVLGFGGCTGTFDAGSFGSGTGGALDSGALGGNPLGGAGGTSLGSGGTSARDAALGSGGTRIVLHDANNYVYSGWVQIPAVAVAPKSDLLFRWGGLTKDMLGHPLDWRRDVNTIVVLMWRLSPTILAGKMRTDTLEQRDLVTLPVRFATDGSLAEAHLSQFKSVDPGVDFATIVSFLDPAFYPPDSYTYTVMAATGSDTNQYCGNRMLQAFRLDPAATNTTVDLTDQSTNLVSNVYFDKLTPVALPAGQADITLDTANVSLNATNGVFDGFVEAFVAHYTQSVAELAQRFTDLELLATELYRGESPDAKTIDLATLTSAQGKRFAGIDTSGTWLVALRKNGCHNPTPLFLTVLRPQL